MCRMRASLISILILKLLPIDAADQRELAMSLFNQLEEMQWKQLRHDENYHKEIWLLTVQQRITHMTLHLSKYGSKIIRAAFSEDSDTLKKIAIDALIIVFSSANIFNAILPKLALSEEELDEKNITSLAQRIFNKYNFKNIDPKVFLALDILDCTGKLCKTVESLDHLEIVNYRESILENLSTLFSTLLALCYSAGEMDIADHIQNRLYSVEQKNPYFKRLGNYQTGYL